MKTIASIICVGHWNTKIFTPKWVASTVFDIAPGKEMGLALNDTSLDLTFSYGGVVFELKDNGVEFRTSKDATFSGLQSLTAAFYRLVNALPHTPIFATGFNVLYTLNNVEFEKTPFVNSLKQNVIAEYTDSSHTFLKRIGDSEMSFIVKRLNEVEVLLNVNYQYNNIINLVNQTNPFEFMNQEIIKVLGNEYRVDIE